MTPIWIEALSEKSAERWLTPISEGIPEDVKRILGSLQSPAYDELECLAPVNSTSGMGSKTCPVERAAVKLDESGS